MNRIKVYEIFSLLNILDSYVREWNKYCSFSYNLVTLSIRNQLIEKYFRRVAVAAEKFTGIQLFSWWWFSEHILLVSRFISQS